MMSCWSGTTEYDVGDWTDIIQVAAGDGHTVGLKSDGTVVAVGSNLYGQCNVKDWTDIIQIAAAYHQTVGLRADGTVVTTTDDNVSNWTNIIQVATGGTFWYYTIVGLKCDGTVVATGDNVSGQCDVGN